MGNSLPRIALDAMGSDRAPTPEINGAVAFARAGHGHIILVGDRSRLTAELARRRIHLKGDDAPNLALSIHHAPDVITMEDSPSAVARRRPDSSMARAFQLVKSGAADAVVTAGNSGAALAIGTITLGRLPGADRPALAGVFPTPEGSTVLVDIGANVECRAEHLVQFAIMGAVYARATFGIDVPKVGLLSNGSEETKGTETTRRAHQLLSQKHSPKVNYVGYVEGRDLWTGKIDVAAVDGFTGNIVLKAVEGVGATVATLLRNELKRSPLATVAWFLAGGALKKLRTRLHWEEVGGAPLLGVGGIAFVAHGGSSAKALQSALAMAARSAKPGTLEQMRTTLAEFGDAANAQGE